MKDFNELPYALKVIINNSDSLSREIEDKLSLAVDKCETAEDLRVKIGEIYQEALKQMTALLGDVSSPVILIDLPETHPCDDCQEMPDCHGCPSEFSKSYYVPRYLRKGDRE